MESLSTSPTVTFGVLQSRLLRFVNRRVQNGEISERALARIVGISQSQMHNILKGARKLQPDVGDRLLAKLGIDLLDLLEFAELAVQARGRCRVSLPPEPNLSLTLVGAHVPPLTHAGGLPARKPVSRESGGLHDVSARAS